MSIIDKKVIEQIGYMPEKRGSYEIDNYLLGESGQSLNPGCWVRGRTVYGDMRVWNQNWGTYSVPVFAYLDHLQTIRIPSDTKYTHAVEVTEGYSTSVTETMEAEVALGSGFILAGAGGVKLSSSYTEGIHGSTKRTQSFEIQGPGVYNFYQVHLVFAHLVTSAGHLDGMFQYSQVKAVEEGREDLCFLTSVASDTVVPVKAESSIKPLGWHEVQMAVLMQGYKLSNNSGRWLFHTNAYHKPGSRY